MKRKRILALVTACCLVLGQSGWTENVQAYGKAVAEQKTEQRMDSAEEEATGMAMPQSVEEITRDVQTLSLGSGYSGAITEDGSLYMWGANTSGQIGNGTTTNQLTPVNVLSNVVSVSLEEDAYDYTAAIRKLPVYFK